MIYVSMTSYPKRITNVSTSIKLIFEKQTLKPDLLKLYLSVEEFPNKNLDLPQDLVDLVKRPRTINEKQKYPVQLVWLEKNTYAHKSMEIFKEVSEDDLVFLVDDDVQYDDKLFETCVLMHQKWPDTIICFNKYSKHIYDGRRIVYKQTGDYSKPRTDTHWCKQSLFPAKLFPMETFKYEDIRTKCSPICVETWYDPFIVKHKIPIYHCNFDWGKDISKKIDSKQGLVKYSHEIEKNGYERRDNWLFNTLIAFPDLMQLYKDKFGYHYTEYVFKQYNGEKGIIALTSWKARIETVYKTIENLYDKCPNFHICLTLSSDEFALKEEELPECLLSMRDKFELIWVKKNYKAFKKFVFALRKYKNLPVVSADDDCLYTCNYAQQLYDVWKRMKKPHIVRYMKTNRGTTQGPCTLYYDIDFPVETLTNDLIKVSRDDHWYPKFFKVKKAHMIMCTYNKPPFIFHDDFEPLTMGQRAKVFYKDCFVPTKNEEMTE